MEQLTLRQYSDLLGAIQARQGWDAQVQALPLTGALEEDLNPLFVYPPAEQKHRKLTVGDLENLRAEGILET